MLQSTVTAPPSAPRWRREGRRTRPWVAARAQPCSTPDQQDNDHRGTTAHAWNPEERGKGR
jgi:hypothetical protein